MKRTFKLTVTEEVEILETPPPPPRGLFAHFWWQICRITISIVATFHGGH